jgi:ferric-dicitrate binding protein FerR (iron transport regulator)
MIENDYIERLIVKNLAGEASLIEKQELKRLMDDDQKIRKQFIDRRDVWNLSNSQEFNSQQAFSKFKERIYQDKKLGRIRRLNWLKYAGIAASLILMVMVGQYLSSDTESVVEYHSFVTQDGERKLATLPDSTKVWLYGNTKLSYTSNFNNSERNVIFEGEAFFDVAHNADLPFKVMSGSHTITVLGTRFNVKANEKVVETVLEEGKVQINVDNNNQQCQLTPGQKSAFDICNNRLTKMDEPVINIYTAITKGQLVFKNEELSSLSPRLEQWYGIQIKLDDDVKNLRFTGTIEKESINDVLNILAMSNNIKFTRINDTITITQN